MRKTLPLHRGWKPVRHLRLAAALTAACVSLVLAGCSTLGDRYWSEREIEETYVLVGDAIDANPALESALGDSFSSELVYVGGRYAVYRVTPDEAGPAGERQEVEVVVDVGAQKVVSAGLMREPRR